MNELKNAADEIHAIITETDINKLPLNTKRHVILGGAIDDEIMNDLVNNDAISEMSAHGKPFVWGLSSQNKLPRILIDFQQKPAKVIVPPFLYVTIPDFVSVVTSNGLYINRTSDGQQQWIKKYKIDIDDNDVPHYCGRSLLTLGDADDTRH